MGSYKVRIREAAVAELLATPFPFRRQINQKIMALKEDPLPHRCQWVTDNLYRIPVAKWWIVYELDDHALEIAIVTVTPAQAT